MPRRASLGSFVMRDQSNSTILVTGPRAGRLGTVDARAAFVSKEVTSEVVPPTVEAPSEADVIEIPVVAQESVADTIMISR